MPEEKKEVSLRLERDEDGNLVPKSGVSPRLGIDVKARPITYGQSRNIDGWGNAVVMWSDEDKLKVLKENLIEPDDFDGVEDVDDLRENFEAFAVEDIVMGIAILSGYGRFFEDDEEMGKEIEV